MMQVDSTVDILFDDGTRAKVEVLDPQDAGRLRQIAEATAAGRSVRIRATAEADTSGHAASADALIVELDLGDDTEAHAYALHFPRSIDARKVEQRLIATGVLAGVLAIGAVGIVAEPWVGTSTTSTTAPVTAPLAAPRVAPGLRAEQIAGDTVVLPAPRVAPGLRAEQIAGDTVALPAPKVAPGLRAEQLTNDQAAPIGEAPGSRPAGRE